MAATPGAMSVLDMQSRILHLLFEPGPDTNGGAVPTTGDFPAGTLLRDLNIALGVYIGRTGLAPSLSEKVLTQTIVAGLDLALPTDCASLTRVEYTPAGMYPYPLAGLSADEFDAATGGVVPPATGQPYYYRRPFAGMIRLQPQPGAGNVAAGDKITWYYTSLGTVLVNPTDVPGIPAQFHMALVYYCLKDYWRRKTDISAAREYERNFEELVRQGKSYTYDEDRSSQPTIGADGSGDDYIGNFG